MPDPEAPVEDEARVAICGSPLGGVDHGRPRRAAVGRQPPGPRSDERDVGAEAGIGETARVTARANGRGARGSRAWADDAVRRIEADANRSARHPPARLPAAGGVGIDLYMKDECGVHPTGSLKHRLARCRCSSRPVQRLDHGAHDDRRGLSGSTAVSGGLPGPVPGPASFVAVMPASTEPGEDRPDRGAGRLVPPRRRPADDGGRGAPAGGRARRALPRPVQRSPSARPTGAGTTTSRVDLQAGWRWRTTPSPPGSWWAPGPAGPRDARPLRAVAPAPTQLCVVDPEDSIFFASWTGDPSAFTGRASRIEGIGRQVVEPSFLPDVRRPDDPGARARRRSPRCDS